MINETSRGAHVSNKILSENRKFGYVKNWSDLSVSLVCAKSWCVIYDGLEKLLGCFIGKEKTPF